MCSSSRRTTSSGPAITRARSCIALLTAACSIAGQLVNGRTRRLLGDEPGLRPRRPSWTSGGSSMRGCMSCHNGYPACADRRRRPWPAVRRRTARGHRLPALPWAGAGACRGGQGEATSTAGRSGNRQSGEVRSGAAARSVHAVPPRVDEQSAAVSDPTATSSPPFSYTPGKPLSDYFIHFDHAAGRRAAEDKFEIAGGRVPPAQVGMLPAQRHDVPHVPRPARHSARPKAVERQVAVCQGCHQGTHRGWMPHVPASGTGATCIDCHMPKRRAEDAVHVVMTDHYIQRRPCAAICWLRAPRPTAQARRLSRRGRSLLPADAAANAGERAVSCPGASATGIEPHVRHSPARTGDPDSTGPTRPEFYYELARAYSKAANYDADISWCREALRRDASFVPALKELAAAATTKGDMAEAAKALEQAVALGPNDGTAFGSGQRVPAAGPCG